MRILRTWPSAVFIIIPVFIIAVDAVVLVRERLQPSEQKAIRLVKESNSRKENFTVQQYLYTTVYHRKSQGESITLEGWRALELGVNGLFLVEFEYADSEGRHVATWEANLSNSTVTGKNDDALDLSWH